MLRGARCDQVTSRQITKYSFLLHGSSVACSQKYSLTLLGSYRYEPEGGALSEPAEEAPDCPRTFSEQKEPRHGPGSPQSPQGGRHSLQTGM